MRETPRVGDEIICIQTPGETLNAFFASEVSSFFLYAAVF